MIKRMLILSTGNKNKVREIKEILKELPIEVVSKDDINLGHIDVVEDGTTLSENSIKKARTLSEYTEYMVMADDSGLFVDALNGDPGVYSNRYAGFEGDDNANNIKLLAALKDIEIEERTAKFITVIALVLEDKEIITMTGEIKGSIAVENMGSNGFGYDPLFIPEWYDRSFAQLGHEIKNEISHRAKALEELKKIITKLLEDDSDENNSSK